MFKNLLKEIKETSQMRITIDTDANGYVDKQCPNTECEFIFKVHKEDGSTIIKAEAMWCPMCGHMAEERQWFTIDQIEQARSEALTVLQGRINQALHEDARQFNRTQPRNSFVKMSMKASAGASRTYALPIAASEVMQLEICCDSCKLRFAVIGAAYFCPGCGANSVERMFQNSLRKIRAKKDNLDLVRTAFESVDKKDDGELTCRSLVETCLQDGVTAFQKYCDRLYSSVPDLAPAPFNAFQRLRQGSELWKAATGVGYEDLLSEAQMAQLTKLFQKRHLLAHSEGVVDDKYIRESGDSAYKAGQRIGVSEAEIDTLVDYLCKLAEGLKAASK